MVNITIHKPPVWENMERLLFSKHLFQQIQVWSLRCFNHLQFFLGKPRRNDASTARGWGPRFLAWIRVTQWMAGWHWGGWGSLDCQGHEWVLPNISHYGFPWDKRYVYHPWMFYYLFLWDQWRSIYHPPWVIGFIICWKKWGVYPPRSLTANAPERT